ncbi:ly6/PLAUR domain-containing protein 2-like [Hyla sarda]|uniref:ly6/PLAUR domain-containing protein 2-like n=1 Tax=Hyla sarda TaxID=327740 RepID=UPI0024C29118|nr:ly6/PLAUR domain-containing protein 2-like [Hyla sarda]
MMEGARPGSEMSQGLLCFTCNTPTTSSACNQPTNCSALSSKFAFCKTNLVSPDVGFPFTGSEQVYRQCAEKCDPTGQNWLGVTRKVLCCNLDLCNRNGIKDGSSSSAADAGTMQECSHNTATTSALNLLTTIVLVLSAVNYSI